MGTVLSALLGKAKGLSPFWRLAAAALVLRVLKDTKPPASKGAAAARSAASRAAFSVLRGAVKSLFGLGK